MRDLSKRNSDHAIALLKILLLHLASGQRGSKFLSLIFRSPCGRHCLCSPRYLLGQDAVSVPSCSITFLQHLAAPCSEESPSPKGADVPRQLGVPTSGSSSLQPTDMKV